MNFLYSAAAAVALVLTAPLWLIQMARRPKYRAGLGERLGRVPARLRAGNGRPVIWVHAVSVGEVLAVSRLIGELQRRLAEPTSAPSTALRVGSTGHTWGTVGGRVVVSTTTATGQKLARERFGDENVFYFPLDFGFAVRPYLRALRPELVIVAETEFWPNFLRLARAGGARIAVVNARISDRSFPRYRRFRAFMCPVLRNIDLFLTQGEEDRRRLLEIGAPADRVQVSGNLKFDIQPATAAPIVASLRQAIQRASAGPVLVCGSTVEGEEPMLLHAFAEVLRKFPGAVMVLAPRHPERFTEVASLLDGSGLRWWRRSQWDGAGELRGGVFLLDSIGELAAMYALAEVAFIGGSLVPRGGHNILEPAQHGAAIVVGPHTENFRDIIALFRRANALQVVSEEQLAPALLDLLSDDARRRGMGVRAAEVLRAHTGATARTLTALESLLVRTSDRVRV